jgi:hypothetical protein
MAEELELDLASDATAYDDLRDAVDNASDQGKRTWLTASGKRVAMIVTVEDGERLEALDETLNPHVPSYVKDLEIEDLTPDVTVRVAHLRRATVTVRPRLRDTEG